MARLALVDVLLEKYVLYGQVRYRIVVSIGEELSPEHDQIAFCRDDLILALKVDQEKSLAYLDVEDVIVLEGA